MFLHGSRQLTKLSFYQIVILSTGQTYSKVLARFGFPAKCNTSYQQKADAKVEVKVKVKVIRN